MAFWRKRNGLKGSLVHPDRQNKKLSATAQRRVLIEEMLAANGSLFSETDKKILNSLLGDQNQPKEWVNPMFKNTIYSDNESREVHGDMPCNFNEDRNARWDQWDESGTEKPETSFSDQDPPENRNQRNQFRGETQDVNLFNPQRSAFIQERSSNQDLPENRNQRNQFRGETQGVNLFNPQRSAFIQERSPDQDLPENLNQRNQFRGETQSVNLFNPQRSAFIQERSPDQDLPENRNQRNQFRGETHGVNLFNPQRSSFIQERSPDKNPPENRNQRNQFRGETQGVNLFNPQRSSFIQERNPLNSERSSLDNNLSDPQRRRMVIEEILAANSSSFSEAHKKTLNSHFSVEDCVRGPFKNTAYSDKESRGVCGDLPYNFDEERRNHEDRNAKNVSGTSFWSNNRNERNQFHPETRDVSPFNPQRSPLISEKSPLCLERSSLEQYGSSNNQQAKNVSGTSFWSKSRFGTNEFCPETRDISPVNPQRNPIIPKRSTVNFKRGSLAQYGNSERNSLEPYGSSSNQQDARNISVNRRTLLDEMIDFESPQDNSGNGIAPLMTQSTQDDSGNNIEILDFKPPEDNSGNGIAPSKGNNYGPIPKGFVRVKMWIDKRISFSDPLHILRQLSQQNSRLKTKSWTFLDGKNNPKMGFTFLVQIRQEHLTVLRSLNMAPCIQRIKTLFKVLKPGEEF